MIDYMNLSPKSLLRPNEAYHEELVPCDGSSFSLPYEHRFLELLEETKQLVLSSECEIHPRLGYEKKECELARKAFKKEDWILAAVILRGERMISGLLVYKKIPTIAYLFDCLVLEIKACYFEGVDIDEGDGTRTDISFFVETLKEVSEPTTKPTKPAPPKKVKHTVILGEDDEEYEAPEVELDSFVPQKKRTFHNKVTKVEPVEANESDEDVVIEVEKPTFSANRKGKPRKI